MWIIALLLTLHISFAPAPAAVLTSAALQTALLNAEPAPAGIGPERFCGLILTTTMGTFYIHGDC